MELKPGKNEARVVVIDAREAVEIKLSRGKFALVDPEDWPTVAPYRWYTQGREPWIYAATWHGRWAHKRGQKNVLMHLLLFGDDSVPMIDHEGHRTLDNRRSQLRAAHNAPNQANRQSRVGTSRHKGVSWNAKKQRWRATICRKGRTTFLGYFGTEEDAAVRYDEVSREIDGEFWCPNLTYTRAFPIWPAA